MSEWSHIEAWKKYRVTDVSTIEEFMAKYYRHDRYKGRGSEYAAVLLASHTKTLEEYGVDWISHHDSNTGGIVSFYPSTPKPTNCIRTVAKAEQMQLF